MTVQRTFQKFHLYPLLTPPPRTDTFRCWEPKNPLFFLLPFFPRPFCGCLFVFFAFEHGTLRFFLETGHLFLLECYDLLFVVGLWVFSGQLVACICVCKRNRALKCVCVCVCVFLERCDFLFAFRLWVFLGSQLRVCVCVCVSVCACVRECVYMCVYVYKEL